MSLTLQDRPEYLRYHHSCRPHSVHTERTKTWVLALASSPCTDKQSLQTGGSVSIQVLYEGHCKQ